MQRFAFGKGWFDCELDSCSEYLQILAKSAGQATVYKRKCVVSKVYVSGSHDKKLWKQISCYKMH